MLTHSFLKNLTRVNLLLATLWLFTLPQAFAAPDLTILDTNGCSECHRFIKDGPPEQRKGPDLFYAGNKFQSEWLVNWLQHPEAIRLSGFITDTGFLKGEPTVATPHPALDADKAKAIADVLLQLEVKNLTEAPATELAEPLSKGKRFKYKILFERDYGCISCHQSINLAKQPRGGVSGPSLLDAGRRLRPDWVYHWLKNPKQFEKRGRMPLFDFTDDELKALSRYVIWHKKGGEK